MELCREVEGFGHIFYRRRRRRVKRKSGNIDDFCRRWGSNYRYMVGMCIRDRGCRVMRC